MYRKCFILFLFAIIAASQTANADERPNFLFVIADDCTHRDLGCYGGQAKTPRMNQLAGEGMKFNQFFQAAPMCSPTRHNIYTGLYPVRSGAYPNHACVKEGTQSVCHYLGDLGYRVALSGKTHISPRKAFPFEYSGKKNPDIKAIDEMVGQCKAEKKPFCVFACSNEPHGPWDKGDPSQYPTKDIKLPDNFVDTPELRDAYSRYLAEITYFDDQVGQLLDILDKHDVADNTVVMVTSEQGSGFPFAKWTLYDPGIQTGMIVRWPGKIAAGSQTDALCEYVDVLPTMIDAAGSEVPKALEGKSLLPVLNGQTSDHKKHVFSMMTTRGILNGSEHYGIRSIRSKQYKLIWNLTPDVEFSNVAMQSEFFRSWEKAAGSGDEDAKEKVHRYKVRPEFELYDITRDKTEWTNLADDSGHAEVVSAMKTRLQSWMQSQGDTGQQTELEAFDHQAQYIRKNRKQKNR